MNWTSPLANDNCRFFCFLLFNEACCWFSIPMPDTKQTTRLTNHIHVIGEQPLMRMVRSVAFWWFSVLYFWFSLSKDMSTAARVWGYFYHIRKQKIFLISLMHFIDKFTWCFLLLLECSLFCQIWPWAEHQQTPQYHDLRHSIYICEVFFGFWLSFEMRK